MFEQLLNSSCELPVTFFVVGFFVRNNSPYFDLTVSVSFVKVSGYSTGKEKIVQSTFINIFLKQKFISNNEIFFYKNELTFEITFVRNTIFFSCIELYFLHTNIYYQKQIFERMIMGNILFFYCKEKLCLWRLTFIYLKR